MAIVVPAHAEGPYIGIGIGAVRHQYESGAKGAAKFFGGYEFNAVLGGEAAYLRRPEFAEALTFLGTSSSGAAIPYGTTATGHATYMAAKASTALGANIILVTKLGLAHTSTRFIFRSAGESLMHKDSANGLYAAIGLQYAVRPRFALSFELERVGRAYSSYSHKPEMFSVNARYSF